MCIHIQKDHIGPHHSLVDYGKTNITQHALTVSQSSDCKTGRYMEEDACVKES